MSRWAGSVWDVSVLAAWKVYGLIPGGAALLTVGAVAGAAAGGAYAVGYRVQDGGLARFAARENSNKRKVVGSIRISNYIPLCLVYL